MQENLVLELKLALAQVDRLRRNAHDQADTHAALVRLLDEGRLDAAYEFLVGHLEDAERDIVEALELSGGQPARLTACASSAGCSPPRSGSPWQPG